MKLIIDIGNTSVTIGLFDGYNLLKQTHFNSNSQHYPAPSHLVQFLNSIREYNIIASVISSVVPKLTSEYFNILNETYKYPCFIINYKHTKLSLKVKEPETIGVDRLCNIVAVKKDYSFPAIIIDFGTAITYDVINNKGEFLGGAIATGVEISAKYLINNAALLSETKLEFPKKVVGTNTTTNIQSGIMFGAIDQVEGMICRIQKETNSNYEIILTGGFSKLISPKLETPHIIDINLTLKGILYIYELNS